MSQQLLTRAANETKPEIPTELDSTSSKLVYLYLRASGSCTIDELQASLDMQKISLYPLLKSLSKKGLVEGEGETYHLAS
ncbi:TrmB family transcriptional regulator [Salinigranum rubrum]|uniref:TrmB family transcriptional regulator n=1 Tax=Salinigranum rubrum TaxID=755307 RepID=A0A2I8VHD7_9EURY|nr:helix-turn-helix domain-containing protein [Salinigranum rubrum]AUV81341.1 TrmB family transcriptional regulator [Salinigranum rubrum]